MKRNGFFILFLCLITAGVIISCFSEDDKDEDSMPCLCFKNNSSTVISGIRYRLSGTDSWTPIVFDENVSTGGDGFDCSEGTFKKEIEEGTYDFEIRDYSNSSTVRGWTDVPYDGGNIGFLVTSTTSGSMYGAVDKECSSEGTAYYADY